MDKWQIRVIVRQAVRQTLRCFSLFPVRPLTSDLSGRGHPVRADIADEGEWAEVEIGRRGTREEGKGSCPMSHKLWHPSQCVFLCVTCGHIFGNASMCLSVNSVHVCVCVCLSVMYATVWVFQALNKMICGFLPPVSSKRVLAFGCGVEVALVQWKKKRDCFPVRGAFWENRGSAYRSRAFKGLWRSAHLVSP